MKTKKQNKCAECKYDKKNVVAGCSKHYKKAQKKQNLICYGDYGNKSTKFLIKKNMEIIRLFDEYFKKRHDKGDTLERIQIRMLQYSLCELCEVERELTFRENE